jgi:NitT/TauT family transport system ATP-binding protein
LLRHWLRLGGIDPEQDVHLVVVPPPYMAESLRNGLLHGFCVGSPWNSLAVDSNVGRIVALGVEIVRHAPEKVLALRQTAAERDHALVSSLIRALRAAARWCQEKDNRTELARLLASPRHLALPEHIISDTLYGNLRVAPNGLRRAHPDFLLLGHETTNRPDPRHANWLYAEMVHAGQTSFSKEAFDAAAAVYRPDLYDLATGEAPLPATDDPVDLASGPRFSERDPAAYLAAL